MTSRTPSSAVQFRPRRKPPKPATPSHLLRTAGEVFAEKGVDAATGLEICKRAGVNSAAINYYFGGMEGLYEAVLIEASGRLPSLEAVTAALAQDTDARAQLRAIIGLAVGVLTGPAPYAWILRLLMREVVSPSPAFKQVIFEAEGLPKLRLFKAIIGEIMGLPVEHPAVAQGCICVLAPCQVMLMGQATILKSVYPELDLDPSGASMLIDRMTAFALGGLAGIVAAETGAGATSSLNPS